MHQMYEVCRKTKLNYRTVNLVLNRPLPAQPGQFVMVWLPGVGEKPYSVSGDSPLTLTVVAVGPVSRALCALEPGDNVWVRGPFGHGFRVVGEKLLLVGGGYGVAPLLFLAHHALEDGRAVEVGIGAARQQDVLLDAAFRAAGCRVWLATEDGSAGTRGLVTQPLTTILQTQPPDGVYACGPEGMLRAVAHLCQEYHIPHQLSWEAHIRCGLGLCGHCECGTGEGVLPPGWLVCQDGPVQIVDYSSKSR